MSEAIFVYIFVYCLFIFDQIGREMGDLFSGPVPAVLLGVAREQKPWRFPQQLDIFSLLITHMYII
jgi:hypothetical protein